MLCSKPYRQGVMEYGCGQCMPCRINRRRTWTSRLLLESGCHEDKCFVTLTYSEECLPNDESLSIRHYQLFLKRLRKALEPSKISYYVVGEYGSRTDRPHYHCVLFGFQPESRGHLVASKIEQLNYYGVKDKILLNAWGLGDCHVGLVEPKSVMYACKHLTKGLKNGVMRIDGKQGEFSRMSLKPAIGLRAIQSFADVLTSEEGSFYISRNFDVPMMYRDTGSLMGFGSFLRRKLRSACGSEEAWNDVSRNEVMVRMMERYQRIGHKGIDDLRRADSDRAKLSKSRQQTRL